MRYVEKYTTLDYLESWKEDQKIVTKKLFYNDFPYKEKLNEDLRREQHNICCYCQRRINHFQGELSYGSHNEHLYPENVIGDEMSLELQLEYSNIYACCIDSRGCEKKLQYCGEAKSNKIIPKLIQKRDCSRYFRYNILGEIIPNGDLDKWDDYVSAKLGLNGHIKEAFDCIETLNLNCITLKIFRYEVLQTFISVIYKWPVEKLEEYINSYEKSRDFQEFIDMKLQYMKNRLKSIK